MTNNERITINPSICHGKPCIKGTRIPVYLILEMLEYGMTIPEILEEYPHLSSDDIRACVTFAKNLVLNAEIFPIAESEISSG